MSAQPQFQSSPIPPAAQVLQMASGYMLSQAIGVTARLGVADQLKDGPLRSEELARTLSVNTDGFYRTLRALASVGIFTETDPGTFANTPLSEALRSDVPESIRAMVLFICDDMHWKVHGELAYSVETGKPAFDHVYGQRPWEYFKANPDQAKAFDDAMAAHSAMGAGAVAGAYDFSGVRKVVDIAGGSGLLLKTVLERNPQLQAVLYDLPHVVEHARRAGLVPLDRCALVPGDFFAGIPAGGDLYVLKHIIHDWDDESARKILSNCRSAMQPASRLLIVEMLLPPGNEPGFSKFLDLEMLALAGGRERSADDMGALLAHAGLALMRVIPTQSPLVIFEAQPV